MAENSCDKVHYCRNMAAVNADMVRCATWSGAVGAAGRPFHLFRRIEETGYRSEKSAANGRICNGCPGHVNTQLVEAMCGLEKRHHGAVGFDRAFDADAA